MEDQDKNTEYNNVVDKLLETFGEVLNRDVMLAIVESYDGDLDESANAIMNITMDGNCRTPSSSKNYLRPNNMYFFPAKNEYINQAGTSQQHLGQFYPANGFYPLTSISPLTKQPPIPYAAAFQQMPPQMINQPLRPIIKSDNAIPSKRSISKNDHQNHFLKVATNPRLQTIFRNHEYGHCTLIILRGAPGSGKTFLAHKIIDTIYNKRNSNYNMHVFSTDQYFMEKGVYGYSKYRLSDAHEWNQNRASKAMKQGVSPVIIDNTNTEIWEMKPYVRSGVKYGYLIEVLEPDTPWAMKAQILYKKNSHKVPFANIQRMLDNFQPNITGPYLLHYYSFQYKPPMTPPIMRSLPTINGQSPEEFSGPKNLNPNYIVNECIENAPTNDYNPHMIQHPLNVNLPQQINMPLADTTVMKPKHPFLNAWNDTPKEVGGENTSSSSTDLNEPTRNVKLGSPTSSSFANGQEEKDKQEGSYALSSLQPDSIPELDNASGISPISNSLEEREREVDKNNSLQERILFDVENKVPSQIEKENYLSIQEPAEIMHTEIIEETLQEFEKVEIEWESGKQWEEESANKTNNNSECQSAKALDAKPQRKNKAIKPEATGNVLNERLTDCQDWTKIAMFLPSWSDENKNTNLPDMKPSTPVVDKISSYTCIEIGDTTISDAKNPYKIISAIPRDINEFHLPITKNKIPDQWMLDKSTSTHENQILSSTKRCKNENEHFKVFLRLFKNVDENVIRDIFEKCCGDINWAVNIVLDDIASQNVNYIMDNINMSDSDIEVPILDCDCLSAYNIIPDRLEAPLPESQTANQEEVQSSINMKKNKKESTVSEASLELKRQIEENIIIPDNHYSEHCLKIRKFRRGEVDTPENLNSENNSSNNEPSTSSQTLKADDQSAENFDNNLPSTSKMCTDSSEISDSASCASFDEDGEKTVNVCIGKEFVTKLDEIYGGQTAECLSFIKPTINIPMSLLSIINALWVESFTDQLQEGSKQSQLMMEQDEELARLLAAKEEELSRLGKEPEIPDFKEIMDMDYALSLYQRDVAEWRNNLPDDLAGKLSREKLYNLFPSISPDVLSELLLAHDNNFHQTVEVLLISTGQTDILKANNGVNKFIIEKEMERQERLLQEEKKALSEVEWPLLPQSEKVDMSTVQQLRERAEKHFRVRNDNYNKANEYLRRGMIQVSTYYLELASFHKTRFEQSNSMAAASLIQIHAANSANNATIDLHYLRVREAKEALDLFLDTHIQKLRELRHRSGIRSHNLFFITGRGLHSHGKPKIKPAVKKRLLERGLTFSEQNPGLLTAKVCADDKLSYQLA